MFILYLEFYECWNIDINTKCRAVTVPRHLKSLIFYDRVVRHLSLRVVRLTILIIFSSIPLSTKESSSLPMLLVPWWVPPWKWLSVRWLLCCRELRVRCWGDFCLCRRLVCDWRIIWGRVVDLVSWQFICSVICICCTWFSSACFIFISEWGKIPCFSSYLRLHSKVPYRLTFLLLLCASLLIWFDCNKRNLWGHSSLVPFLRLRVTRGRGHCLALSRNFMRGLRNRPPTCWDGDLQLRR